MSSLKRGDHIICSHLDRFSRNTLNLLTLVEKFKKQKVSLHFVDIGSEVTGTDAMGSVFFKLLSVFAEFYAKQVSEKSNWVFNILKRESTIPSNEEIIRHNICNVELQPNICDV
jgi:hypothetical protein